MNFLTIMPSTARWSSSDYSPSTITGVISINTDDDWYTVTLPHASGPLSFQIVDTDCLNGVSINLSLYNAELYIIGTSYIDSKVVIISGEFRLKD